MKCLIDKMFEDPIAFLLIVATLVIAFGATVLSASWAIQNILGCIAK